VATRSSNAACDIWQGVDRHIEGELPPGLGVRLDRAFQRDRIGIAPLIDCTLGYPKSLGSGSLGAAEKGNDVSFSHGHQKYSMLNMQVKDAVQPCLYAELAMETMGDRIRQLRKARGHTQEAFAKLVGVTKSAVSQWEDGSTKNLKLATFLRACEVLVTDPEFLIWGDDRAPSGGATKKAWKSRPAGKPSGT
jgi:DNA-binding transcriptional regulator YiaG